MMQIVWLFSLAGDVDDFDDGVDGHGYLLTFPLPLPRTVTILFCGRSVLLLRRRNHHTPNNPRPLTSKLCEPRQLIARHALYHKPSLYFLSDIHPSKALRER
jgi:hypothetical protein